MFKRIGEDTTDNLEGYKYEDIDRKDVVIEYTPLHTDPAIKIFNAEAKEYFAHIYIEDIPKLIEALQCAMKDFS